jgi:hypothetical protein
VKAAIGPDPSPEEVAAIVAALERFALDHALAAPAAPDREPAQQAGNGWRRVALLEGVQGHSDWGSSARWNVAWINA